MKYGRYEVVEELGKGATGVVYKALDPKIGRMIALKVLREDKVTNNELVQRFLKEAMAIGRLSDSNIVTVYDVGSDHGTVFIAEELIQGRPLDEIMRQDKLEIREIIRFGVQIANALHNAHEKGIIHRDIKPSNILVNSNSQIKITDFGIAHIEDSDTLQLTKAGEILGTPYYMSPEQLLGRNVDRRSDIFSLGVMLYEMAAGIRPFRGKTLPSIFNEITEKVPDSPKVLDENIPSRMSTIILKALEKKPEHRYNTAKELSGALQSIEIKSNIEDKTSNKKNIIMAVLVILIISSIAGYLLIPKSRAVLRLESDPEGARVFLDGDLKGMTPMELKVPLGKYELRLNKQNFYEWQAQIQIEEKGQTPVFIKLHPLEL